MPQTQLNALILAAGYGTRLKEVGEKTAKGLFKNRDNFSILDLILLKLSKNQAVNQVALVTNNRFYTQYNSHLSSKYPNANITIINDYSTEPENRLGSLGDLHFAVDSLSWWGKNLLVLPSDRTPENIIISLIKSHKNDPDSFIVGIINESKEKIKNKSGCAAVDQHNNVVDFEEKPASPKSNYLALPFYIFPSQALTLLKKYKSQKNNMDSPGNIVPWLIAQNYPVKACLTEKKSFDIGNLEELANFQSHYSIDHQ